MNWTMIHFTMACAPPMYWIMEREYENLGMINLVYTYSKGLEVLVLPLSGTPTYGFVLAFLCGVPGILSWQRISWEDTAAGKRNPGSRRSCRYSGNHEYGGHCKKR